MNAQIWGVGTSYFGKQPDLTGANLTWQAVIEAFDDAGVDSVDAVFVGTVFGHPGVAQRVLHTLGIVDVPIVTIDNACASGTSAFHEAHAALLSGRHERVLVLGIEQMTQAFGKGAIHPELTDAEGSSGLAMPGQYAMSASRYLHEGWVTEKQLAQVSVKNHLHAEANDRAQYSGRYTIEEVLASPPIADPLTLLQCCAISDAAAAVVIGNERGNDRDVRVRTSQHRSGSLWDHRTDHAWGFEAVRDVSQAAYEAAGIGPGDIDLFEVHDAFTIGEIVATEALGLAPEGGGGELVERGHTTLGGKQPVNPSGGLLSRGHPLGATGTAQIAEAVWQLRGDAGERQVRDARVAAVETIGGGVSGIDANAAVVVILGQ